MIADDPDNITSILCRKERSCNSPRAKGLRQKRRAPASRTPRSTRSRRSSPPQVLPPHPELSNTFKHRKPNPALLKTPKEDRTEDKKSVASEEWPHSNKRRYLKNYQLPKINSPTRLRKEEVSEYENTHPEDLLDDEEKLSHLSFIQSRKSPSP
jgi:hypothetical protein